MSNKKADLAAAMKAKKDEFYTRLSEIEAEVWHYHDQLRGKVVYCNCDDPRVSNFYRYFHCNFDELGLKGLMATCYRSGQADAFSQGEDGKGLLLDYRGKVRGEVVRDLEGDGDFRSAECVAILQSADVVITNPPFSLFREYIAQLIAQGKKFLVIGNLNASAYSEIFPLFMENKVWYGPSIKSGDRAFEVPEHYPMKAAKSRVDQDGRRFVWVKGIRWFTNMPHKRRNERVRLYADYSPHDHPKYENYDAIEVSKVSEIPVDYDGVMGVPITFLDKHNPAQFEIVGLTSPAAHNGFWSKQFTPEDGPDWKKLNTNAGPVLEIDGVLRQKYKRILIRAKG